jgi:Tripartite tricarboxylate transporter family receptor
MPRYTKNWTSISCASARVVGESSIPVVLVVSPSFRVKTGPELIAYAKANQGKITTASRFSVRPPVAPTKLEDLKQRDQQLEPLQRKALEKRGRIKH